MNPQTAPTARHASGPAVAYNLAGIAVLVLLGAVGAAYLVDELSRASRAPQPALTDTDPITQTIAGRELSIPTRWFRFGEQIRDGFTNQIDLQVTFAPEGVEPTPVNVTLLPPSRARTSASLLDSVYLHQFSDETLHGAPGLVGKPMASDRGFAGESVWYDAISPNPFVAKCLAESPAGETGQCVRTVYLPTGIAAVYTFDASLLASWRLFDPEMERWLTSIGAL